LILKNSDIKDSLKDQIEEHIIKGLCERAITTINTNKGSLKSKFKQELDNMHGEIKSRLGMVKGHSQRGNSNGEETEYS